MMHPKITPGYESRNYQFLQAGITGSYKPEVLDPVAKNWWFR